MYEDSEQASEKSSLSGFLQMEMTLQFEYRNIIYTHDTGIILLFVPTWKYRIYLLDNSGKHKALISSSK